MDISYKMAHFEQTNRVFKVVRGMALNDMFFWLDEAYKKK
jgi:hypothetical protein